jgi:hypothetical protein
MPINAPATSVRGPRRSFAAASFAGFSPMSPQSPKTLPAPYSPHGPDAAGRVLGGQGLGIQRKVMSPEEVLDVARSLASPVALPEGGLKRAELKRRKSAGATSRSSSKASPSPEKPPLALEPVEYVQLDDNTLLPFVERPQEVAELMQHPSNTALFKLLQAAFPKNPAREHWKALSPAEWNWEEFVQHLTKVTRAECPDYPWVFRAREAVRTRSVALWEKLGVCLGCDADLLNAGGEDGSPPSWGGLGLGEEGEYDPSANHVWIEGLEAVDPKERERIEREFRDEFGDIVEDENEQAAAGMTALLGTVGEEEEDTRPNRSRQTTAQREANRKLKDPMDSPSFAAVPLPPDAVSGHSPYTPHSPAKFGSRDAKGRSKSFVGLQILTSPVQPTSAGLLTKSPMSTTPIYQTPSMAVYDRGPGSPLFPSSFSSLSVEPNLGRSASVALGGVKAAHPVASAYDQGIGLGMDRGDWGIRRKPSGAGLSESTSRVFGLVRDASADGPGAITFASESDYSHSAPGDHDRHF